MPADKAKQLYNGQCELKQAALAANQNENQSKPVNRPEDTPEPTVGQRNIETYKAPVYSGCSTQAQLCSKGKFEYDLGGKQNSQYAIRTRPKRA